MKSNKISISAELQAAVESIKPDRKFVLTDTTTLRLCWPEIAEEPCLKESTMITIEPTDEAKTLTSLAYVWEALCKGGATRASLLVCLGGGMVTDLGGFAAATFKRGIAHINIPTTLLAMVDASEGGKTGINFMGLKNEIGSFYSPRAVLLDTHFLRTLDHQNLLSGFAEMLKHSLLSSDAELARHLQFDFNNVDYALLANMVKSSVAVKRNIVQQDPHEHGIRRALNLGHTIGHALESLALQQNRPVLHGYAVAWGLVAELYLSARQCGFPTDRLHQVAAFVRQEYGCAEFTCRNYGTLLTFMRHDKKNTDQRINFTLLSRPGDVQTDHHATDEEICEALDFLREGA